MKKRIILTLLTLVAVIGILAAFFVDFEVQEWPCAGGYWKVQKIVHPDHGELASFSLFPGIEIKPESCISMDNSSLLATFGCAPDTVITQFDLYRTGLRFEYQDQKRATDTFFYLNDTMRFRFDRCDLLLTRVE